MQYYKNVLLYVLSAVLCVCSADILRAEEPVSKVTPDYTYWRGERETSPGPYLCIASAATDVVVTCDRWPDATDLRNFARDAIRLSKAETPEEKALAVWRWLRRVKIHTDGNPPQEMNSARTRLLRNNDPVKIMNVYGAHYCGGLSRVAEVLWRAAGYRADRVHCGSHSMVDLFYTDSDGKGRYHLFDVNFGGFMYHISRTRLMSPDDWCTGYDGGKANWEHSEHWPWSGHRMELSLRTGERLERYWYNIKKPYQDNTDLGRDRRRTRKWERGPYDVVFGNGMWEYSPDLSSADWHKGLAVPAKGMKKGKLQPAEAGVPGTAQWAFRTPYIISEAEISIKAFRKSAEDVIRVYLSLDSGATWKQCWQASDDEITKEGDGTVSLNVKLDRSFPVYGGSNPPKDFYSPFGQYRYRLKLELLGKQSAEDVEIKDIRFRTVVQLNVFSLPQLHPGKNRITVKGTLSPGTALKVYYRFVDLDNKTNINSTIIEKTPHTYEILAAGKVWEDVISEKLRVEAIPATGEGNRTVVKEKPPHTTYNLPPMRPVAETRGRFGGWQRRDPAHIPSTKELVKFLKTGSRTEQWDALRGLIELRNPESFEHVRKYAYSSPHNKKLAFAILYATDPDKAKPVLLDILSHPDKVKWTSTPRTKGPDNQQQHWTAASIAIGVIAKEAGWKEFIPGLVSVLEKGKFSKHFPSHALMRAIAGIPDKRALPVIRKHLKHGRGYTAAYAALAAARIGDTDSIPLVRKLLSSRYRRFKELAITSLGILKDTESAPALRNILLNEIGDENLRAAAGEALGAMNDTQSAPALRASVKAEPIPWVREKLKAALNSMGEGKDKIR